MLRFLLDKDKEAEHKLLFLGAHSDDIEIGCGGTVLRMAEEYPNLNVSWIIFSSGNNRSKEAQESAELFLDGVSRKDVIIKNYRDGFFPFIGTEIKDYFEKLKEQINPDIIFTHFKSDAHQDHRLIAELTWNTWRDHLILEYEIPKYDGDLAAPNLFVHLSDSVAKRKSQYMIQCFQTQNNKDWFTEDSFQALMRLRGLESRAPEKYAEAYHCRKVVL